MAAASASARRAHKRVQVPSLDTVYSTTYANPNGSYTKVASSVPLRARASNGKLETIDTRLHRVSGRLRPRVSTARLSLRATGSRVAKRTTAARTATKPTTIRRGAGASKAVRSSADDDPGSGGGTADVVGLDPPGPADLTMGYGASLGTPSVSGDTATYALSSTSSLTAQTLDDGFAEDVVLTAAPGGSPVYRFPLTVAGGLTPVLKDGTLQFDNADGSVAAISRPLQLWDSQVDAAGDPSNTAMLTAALARTRSGWELDLTPSVAFLTDASTVYPVTIDPTVMLQSTDPSNSDNYFSAGGTVRLFQ